MVGRTASKATNRKASTNKRSAHVPVVTGAAAEEQDSPSRQAAAPPLSPGSSRKKLKPLVLKTSFDPADATSLRAKVRE